MNSIHEAPLLQSFREVANFSKHAPVPEGWVLLLCDVRGSTQAVHEGRYKDVNTVGASSIIAVLNATGDEVAYSFGGDGAVFLVPPGLADKATDALLGTRRL